MGTPGNVDVGPGLLYVAPIGTAEPTTPTATPDEAWVAIGYTDTGNVFTANTTIENVEVAEELDPIRKLATRRDAMVEFAMAEFTATNLSIAFNGGQITGPTGGYVSFEPPDLGDEQRLMLMWRDDYGEEQLVCRRVIQIGSLGIPRNKAPNKAVIPVQLGLEKPLDGSKIFEYLVPASRSYTDPH